MAKHHGVAAGNVLYKRIVKAGRAADAGAQADGMQLFVDDLCAAAVKACTSVLVLAVPLHGALQFVVQPHIVLVAKGKEVLGSFDWSLCDQVAKVPG